MSDRVIGLDIGASSVKAVQVLRHGDGTFTIEKQAARALPKGAVHDGRVHETERLRVTETIRQMFAEESFDTKDVIFGLNSSSAVFMQEMVVPYMEPNDVEKSMPLIIEARNSNIDASENEFSYTIVEEFEDEDGRQLRVLVYSARADYAQSIGEIIEAAGLTVVGADLNALAVLRAIAVYPRPDDQLDAIVDIGANITMLMLHHNGVPKMLRLDPDSAGDVATERVLAEMGLDDEHLAKAEWEKVNNQEPVGAVYQARTAYAEGLAIKVAGGFRDYLDKSYVYNSLANVTIVGGGALLHGLGYHLRESLGAVPLAYAVIDDSISTADGREVEQHENKSGGDYLVAIGLGTAARI